jgi:hypothetical protein
MRQSRLPRPAFGFSGRVPAADKRYVIDYIAGRLINDHLNHHIVFRLRSCDDRLFRPDEVCGYRYNAGLW